MPAVSMRRGMLFALCIGLCGKAIAFDYTQGLASAGASVGFYNPADILSLDKECSQ